MSTDETYNGWTNRETWAVALHINNDQGWQESVHEALRDYVDNFEPSDDFDRPNSIGAGDIIQENVEQWIGAEGLYDEGQLYGVDGIERLLAVREDIGSLWRVNWTELGAAFLSDLDES